jgi:hypothetical protein
VAAVLAVLDDETRDSGEIMRRAHRHAAPPPGRRRLSRVMRERLTNEYP